MDIHKVTTPSTNRLQYPTGQAVKVSNKSDDSDVKVPEKTDKVEISSAALEAAVSTEVKVNENDENRKAFSILKMSDEARAKLVEKLKGELEQNTAKLIDFVRNNIVPQGTTFANTDDVWKFIATGEYTVDEKTKAEAQKAIFEDGFYGVKKTSERIFEFALGLTGGDEKLMKEMEVAIAEGFRLATETWGKELPDITKDTREAIKQKFSDYYDSLKPADAKVEKAEQQ